jgi:hypothetical protein
MLMLMLMLIYSCSEIAFYVSPPPDSLVIVSVVHHLQFELQLSFEQVIRGRPWHDK